MRRLTPEEIVAIEERASEGRGGYRTAGDAREDVRRLAESLWAALEERDAWERKYFIAYLLLRRLWNRARRLPGGAGGSRRRRTFL